MGLHRHLCVRRFVLVTGLSSSPRRCIPHESVQRDAYLQVDLVAEGLSVSPFTAFCAAAAPHHRSAARIQWMSSLPFGIELTMPLWHIRLAAGMEYAADEADLWGFPG